MNTKFDVVAIGELLMDFTNNGISEQGNVLFEANPGGAPCNVLAMLAEYGHKTSFIGKVGNDMMGHRLKDTLEELSIDSSNLVMDDSVRTTLAFVHNHANGEREFSFYRNPGADMMLTKEELENRHLNAAGIFHFGTLSLTNEPVRGATKYALAKALEQDALISFDPNLRESLWESKEEAKEQVQFGLAHCDIVKLSEEELVWLTGMTDNTEAIACLKEQYHIPLILLSLGTEGSRAYYKDSMVEAGAFIQENTVDTTGAGDTFLGSCIHFVLKYGIEHMQKDQLKEMLLNANAAAALITTKKGALRSMPKINEIKELMNQTNEG